MTPSVNRAGVVGIVSTGLLFFGVAVLAYFAIVSHSALCSFTHDLERRIDSQQKLLDSQKGPVIDVFPGSGTKLEVPRTVLETQLAQQRLTSESITGGFPSLSC